VLTCPKCAAQITYPAPTIDKIAPYYNFPDYISHTDVKEGFINKLYHKVRLKTLQQKTAWVQSLFTGHKGNLLEVGAGTGAFANAMSNKGWNVTALEPDALSRKRAFDNYGITLLPTENLYTLKDNSYEVITLWHVLEHVHDLNGYLNSFHKLLKPNGRLIIAVPNYTSYDAKFYGSYWAAYDVPRHLYHFSPLAITALTNRFSMKIVQIKPMWFDSFYVSLLSEKYKASGTFGMIKAFLIGGMSNLFALKNNAKASSLIYEIKKV
jgi:ubiquinone/menaquinone biosynthesis C-methylase UbiE